MKHYTIALSMLAGAALGAAAVQTIHAQAKAPAYSILEAEVSNREAYAKEYLPKVRSMFEAAGSRRLSGMKIVAIEGDPPKEVAILCWDSMEQLTSFFNSAKFR
jgi:uncharacterized protein (DUF1330 family)